MEKREKRPINVRLPKVTHDQLKELKSKLGHARQSDVIVLAVDRLYRQEVAEHG